MVGYDRNKIQTHSTWEVSFWVVEANFLPLIRFRYRSRNAFDGETFVFVEQYFRPLK